MITKDKRPLVSIIFTAYKHEHFISAGIKSAFAQTYEPLEIIFSDDCSPDRTYEIIKEEAAAYKGPHKIILNRNEKNLGKGGNMNRAFKLSHGQFIIVFDSDDCSVPERTSLLVERLMDTTSPVDCVCSYLEQVDANGNPLNQIYTNVRFVPDISKRLQKWECGATGATTGYSRKIFEKYDPLDERVIAEDWVLPFRAWLESDIGLIQKPLVIWRLHEENATIVYRDIKHDQQKESRRLKRLKSCGDRLARVEDWYNSWKKSGNKMDPNIEIQFHRFIKLLQLEWRSYHSSRFVALKAAFLSLKYLDGGFRNAVRIFVRNVLRHY